PRHGLSLAWLMASGRGLNFSSFPEAGGLPVWTAGAVDAHDAAHVTFLEGAELLLIVHRHDLTMGTGMVEADGMTDLVRQRITQVVDGEIAVEADLPAFHRI